MTRDVRPTRPARPKRTAGGGTTTARGATFGGQTRGTGLAVVPSTAAGPLGEGFRGRFGAYAPICQGWIALTIKHPVIGPKVNFHNVGTGPELVVCGFFLARNYTPGRDLFFQEDKVVIDDVSRTSRKEFIVDVAVNDAWGNTVYLNIDGIYFHTRTELQQFKDAIRNGKEAKTGKPVDVPDTFCYDPMTLMDLLDREQVAA